MLQRLAEHGLIKGDRIGVDASTIEANAALRTIGRRDTGEGYGEGYGAMLERRAAESGIATPTAENLIRLDRQRKGKRLSNADRASPTDPETRLAKLKDGRTHLAYKPEHAVDLDTGAIVAAEIHLAHQGDTTTLPATLKAAQANLAAVDAAPRRRTRPRWWRPRAIIPVIGSRRWRVGPGRAASPRRSSRGSRAGTAMMTRGRRCTTTAPGCAQGGPRRCSGAGPSCASAASRWGSTVAGCGYADAKRYLVHVAGYNLGRLMRLLVGAGTPRELVARAAAHLLMLAAASGAALIVLTVMTETEAAMLVVSLEPEPHS